MKQNRWLLPAVCSCTAFFAGLITGLSLSDRKGRKKTDALPMPHSIKEETSDATKEDCPDE